MTIMNICVSVFVMEEKVLVMMIMKILLLFTSLRNLKVNRQQLNS